MRPRIHPDCTEYLGTWYGVHIISAQTIEEKNRHLLHLRHGGQALLLRRDDLAVIITIASYYCPPFNNHMMLFPCGRYYSANLPQVIKHSPLCCFWFSLSFFFFSFSSHHPDVPGRGQHYSDLTLTPSVALCTIIALPLATLKRKKRRRKNTTTRPPIRLDTV